MSKTKKGKPMPLHVPADLKERIEKAAGGSGLSQADIMRMSIKRGIAAVEEMFELKKKAA